MAGYSSGRNTFLDDDGDIDDEEFLRRSRESSGFMLNNDISRSNPQSVSLDDKIQELLQKKRESERKSISSTERSLSFLRNSEEVGAVTAEQLHKQREQLERTEKRLDDINTTLRFSQRHIQGIKSVFGGLKNLISGKTGTPPSTSSKSTAQNDLSTTDLYEVVDRNNAQKKMVESTSLHPGLKIRGMYEPEASIPETTRAEDIIDRNLGEMLTSIHRLKDMSYHLGSEIESQNELIDKVIDKTEKAGSTIQKQNKDMNKLLK